MLLVLAMLANLRMRIGLIAQTSTVSRRKIQYSGPPTSSCPDAKSFFETDDGGIYGLESYLYVRKLRQWRNVEDRDLEEAGKLLAEWKHQQKQPAKADRCNPTEYFKNEPLFIFTPDWRPLKLESALAYVAGEKNGRKWWQLRIYTKGWIHLSPQYICEEIITPFEANSEFAPGSIGEMVGSTGVQISRWAGMGFIPYRAVKFRSTKKGKQKGAAQEHRIFSFTDLLAAMIFMMAKGSNSLECAGAKAKSLAPELLEKMKQLPTPEAIQEAETLPCTMIEKTPAQSLSGFRRVVALFDKTHTLLSPERLLSLFPDEPEIGCQVVKRLTGSAVIERLSRGEEALYRLLPGDHTRKIGLLESLYQK